MVLAIPWILGQSLKKALRSLPLSSIQVVQAGVRPPESAKRQLIWGVIPRGSTAWNPPISTASDPWVIPDLHPIGIPDCKPPVIKSVAIFHPRVNSELIYLDLFSPWCIIVSKHITSSVVKGLPGWVTRMIRFSSLPSVSLWEYDPSVFLPSGKIGQVATCEKEHSATASNPVKARVKGYPIPLDKAFLRQPFLILDVHASDWFSVVLSPHSLC